MSNGLDSKFETDKKNIDLNVSQSVIPSKRFDKKKSIQSDFAFCQKIDKKCLDEIENLNQRLKQYYINQDFYKDLFNRNTDKYDKAEIQRLKLLQKNLISKKYVFENKTVYITQRPYLIGDRDQIDHINNIEYISKDHEHGRFYLNFQISGYHEKLGKVLEIWEQYEIKQQDSKLYDLKNIRFETLDGRDFCESYRELIFGENNESRKINIKKIFSYTNIIQSPEQNKFYDLIIKNRQKFILVNGQAGTGKTTVAMDALKNTETIFIVLNHTKKTEIEKFYVEKNNLAIILFDNMHSLLNEELNCIVNNDYSFVLEQVEILATKVISDNTELLQLLQLDEIVIIDELKKSFEIIQALILSNSIEPINIEDLIQELKTKLSNLAIKINNIYISTKVPFIKNFDLKQISKIKFRLVKPESSKERDSYKHIKVVLEETIAKKSLNIANIKFTHKRTTYDFIDRLLNKRKNKFNKKAFEDIEKIIYTQQFINKCYFKYKSPDIVFLTKCYLAGNTKFLFFKKIDKTVLIDEYQQLKQSKIIDIYKIIFKRVLLVGDDVQSNQTDIYKPKNNDCEKLIFTRNFRQTYQLAIASLVVRNLITNDGLKFPKENEYYKDQIEFNGERYKKPCVYKKLDLDLNMVMEKLLDIKKDQTNKYEHDFPIMIVFEESAKSKITILYKNLAEKFKTIYFNNLRENSIESFDFIFLTIHDIQGEEAPIVVYISDDEKINLSHLYISITRAQFEYYCFLKDMPIFMENKTAFDIFDKDAKSSFVIKQVPLHISEEAFDEKIKNKEEIQHQDVNHINYEQSNKENFHQNRIVNSKQYVETKNAIGEDAKKRYEETTTKQNIQKHKSETYQWQEDIDPDVIIDEEKYKTTFINKVIADMKSYENSLQGQDVVKKIIILKKSSVADNKLKNQIKLFLANTYKGYCQVCGFTFRKVADGENSFEMHSWNDKRVVKNKKSFVSTADSLCLCRNCSANIKWGAFTPIFLEHIEKIEKFEKANFNDVAKIIHKAVEQNKPDVFEGYLDFSDMYALEIKLNYKPRSIYFTTAHLIQFIAYLQLENSLTE
jgi:hypothetical protein